MVRINLSLVGTAIDIFHLDVFSNGYLMVFKMIRLYSDCERVKRLAIANPKLAPYGRAAQQTLARLGLTDRAEAGLVIGENVGQAWAMMQLGGADAGLVAASLLQASADRPDHWMVPANLHDPIEQAMVLLPRAKGNAAARAFVRFLRSAPGRALIQRQGYETHASSTP